MFLGLCLVADGGIVLGVETTKCVRGATCLRRGNELEPRRVLRSLIKVG